MLSEREDLTAPHPPHIMRDFMPRLEKYGDLSVQENLKVSVLFYFSLLVHLEYDYFNRIVFTHNSCISCYVCTDSH